MDAVEFQKVRKRMCIEYKTVCSNCPLTGKLVCTIGKYIENEEVQEAVEIAEKWAEEHPAETYKSEYLRAAEYVGAKPWITEKPTNPSQCVKYFFGTEAIPPNCMYMKCSDCWDREIE